MPRQSKTVEVLTVSRAVESNTGKTTFQVTFGVVGPVDDELRPFLPQMPGSRPPKEVGFNHVILFYPFAGTVPYRVGSRWQLAIRPDGALSLEPSKGGA